MLEYETHLAVEGKSLKECGCGYNTHRDKCPDCGKVLSGDKEVDDILAQIDAGEDIDLDMVLRKDKTQWEPVQPGEL